MSSTFVELWIAVEFPWAKWIKSTPYFFELTVLVWVPFSQSYRTIWSSSLQLWEAKDCFNVDVNLNGGSGRRFIAIWIKNSLDRYENYCNAFRNWLGVMDYLISFSPLAEKSIELILSWFSRKTFATLKLRTTESVSFISDRFMGKRVLFRGF